MRKLRNLEVAYHILRHITAPFVSEFVGEITKQLATTQMVPQTHVQPNGSDIYATQMHAQSTQNITDTEGTKLAFVCTQTDPDVKCFEDKCVGGGFAAAHTKRMDHTKHMTLYDVRCPDDQSCSGAAVVSTLNVGEHPAADTTCMHPNYTAGNAGTQSAVPIGIATQGIQSKASKGIHLLPCGDAPSDAVSLCMDLTSCTKGSDCTQVTKGTASKGVQHNVSQGFHSLQGGGVHPYAFGIKGNKTKVTKGIATKSRRNVTKGCQSQQSGGVDPEVFLGADSKGHTKGIEGTQPFSTGTASKGAQRICTQGGQFLPYSQFDADVNFQAKGKAFPS